jgi:hypothetical protein
MLIEPSPTPTSGALHAQQRVGWQSSRFLTDRAEAERAYALAEQLGSVNAAANQLGTTWPSLRKAFTRHGLGMPTRNPEAVRQRAIAAARQRSGQPVEPAGCRHPAGDHARQGGAAGRPDRRQRQPEHEQRGRIARRRELAADWKRRAEADQGG